LSFWFIIKKVSVFVKNYNCIIFDLDGTLLDTSGGVLKAIDYLIEHYQLRQLSQEEKLSFIGPPIEKSIQKAFQLTEDTAWELAGEWREIYKEKFLLEAKPYNGIYELLDYCRKSGRNICVATNKREDYAVKLLNYYNFIPYFDFIVGADFEGTRTKASMIKDCATRFHSSGVGDALMIGDTNSDLNGAKEAGIDFLGVTYGFGFKERVCDENQGVVGFFDTCKKVEKWLMGL
jgi:phosphoglycolate phosphatase